MKKILVLFATVVVMMMVTGCKNPADVHIPTQEELWMRDGYRYCGDVDERDKGAVSQFFSDFGCEYEFTENGKCYVKFPLNDNIVNSNRWNECENGVPYKLYSQTTIRVFKDDNGKLDRFVFEPYSQQ